MSLDTHDFDEFGELLAQFSENDETLVGDEHVTMTDLFADGFVAENTAFDGIEAFFDASPWDVESGEDFAGIPADELDAYVAEHSAFSDWETMLSKAGADWVERRIDR